MALHVNVNTDMTKYLPDNSQMKRGLEVLTWEFGSAAQMSGADVHVMFADLDEQEVPGIRTLLSSYPDVNGVTYRYSADSAHTVFDLDVPKTIDQKALGKHISSRFGGNCIVETSQDGATPPMFVLVFAAVLIMVVLFVMAQSWFEPVVILLTAGLAILLNMGTNALLPSVSITTHFIGAILQAVLSLDYCIVLLNRYRQEQDEHTDRQMAILAANRAIKRAAPSILSSALTTVVGLLMLCFMRLKIGADMGVVLAKGVVCSLICTFTVLPSLMLLFRRVINHTAKAAYIPPTDGMARFVARHKLPIAVAATLLFVSAWMLSRQTTIFFAAGNESQIEKFFPAPNPYVLLYETQDEDAIYSLVDGLQAQTGVDMVISYPTLMRQPLTPAEMTEHVKMLLTDFKDFMPEGTNVPQEALDALQPQLVEMLYYIHAHGGEQDTLSFPELARFLHTHVASNPLFGTYLDAEMKAQIARLQSMLDVSPIAPVAEPEPVKPVLPKPAEPLENIDTPDTPENLENPETPDTIETPDTPETPDTITPITPAPAADTLPAVPERINLVPFIARLNATQTSVATVEMHKLTDTAAIRLPMSVNEMSLFIGSTPTQTRLVYGYAPGVKKMSPLQYVHLLVDDLFKRPGLAGMISDEQRTQLTQRTRLMDLADDNAALLPDELNALLQEFGVDSLTTDDLWAISGQQLAASTPHEDEEEEATKVIEAVVETPAVAPVVAAPLPPWHKHDTTPAELKPIRRQPRVVHKAPSREDMQAELFTELVFGGEAYTADVMATKLARLMELSEVKSAPVTAEQMSLLYDYYGYAHSKGCDTLRVGFEALVTYLCDTLVNDPRLADILPDSIRAQAAGVRGQLTDGLGQLRHEGQHSLLVVLSSLPKESQATYDFVDTLTSLADARLDHEHYYIGESVMYAEMRGGFDHEMNVVTLLTVLAIFLIVALTFRSVIVPTILVMTVMSAVYVNVVAAGLVTGQMLYLAYLIVQAILMGATIDYGILFANYYREYRKTMLQVDAVCAAYRGSIRTILTSGLITVIGPGAMALVVDDMMISNIVGCIAAGAFMAVTLTLTVVPAVLVALDKWVVYGKQNRFSGLPDEDNELSEAAQAASAESTEQTEHIKQTE